MERLSAKINKSYAILRNFYTNRVMEIIFYNKKIVARRFRCKKLITFGDITWATQQQTDQENVP